MQAQIEYILLDILEAVVGFDWRAPQRDLREDGELQLPASGGTPDVLYEH